VILERGSHAAALQGASIACALQIKKLTIDLNPPQREAVEHTEGPLLILAGAGSGKTRVLIARAAYIVQEGLARPYQILALTFTNKAANELRTRAADMIGAQGAYLTAGTFHSIFARLMRQEGRNIDLDPNFTIIDTDDRRRLIKAILKEMSIVGDYAKPAAIEWQISRAKNALVGPKEYASMAKEPLENTVAIVYEVYERRMRKMNGLDFDDLLIRPLEAFQKYPDFLNRLRNRFRYVMVDEYQDTNRAQYLLVREIAKKTRNLCVVGDDDQAIYGWRGATVRNILDFKRDWDDAKVIRLEQNYRSTRPILDTAWSIIHHNKERHPKKLWTERSGGELIEVLSTNDDEEEALRFVGIIDDLHRIEKLPYNRMAILYRTNAQSLPFERALRGTQIPYNVVGGLRFYERKEVKDVLAYLRVILNPSDDVSLLRIINYPPRAIGQVLGIELQARARVENISLSEAISLTLQDDNIPERQRNALSKFVNLMEDLRKNEQENGFHLLAAEVVDRIELEERLKKEEKADPSRAESKLGNVRNLLAEIMRFVEDHPEAGLHDFLEEVTLVTDADNVDQDQDWVNLLTLHSSKGLEFRVVFIGGLEEGILPLKPPNGSREDIQEERRLFYVGVTRAMDRLVLGFALNRLRWGSVQWNGPSRFLDEIPDEHLKNPIRKKQKTVPYIQPFSTKLWSSQPNKKSTPSGASIQPDAIRKGMLVRHPKFGLGIVIGFNKMGLDSRLKVDFDEYGEKTLILRYARLEKVK